METQNRKPEGEEVLRALPPEELSQIALVSSDDIQRALEDGGRDLAAAEASSHASGGLRNLMIR